MKKIFTLSLAVVLLGLSIGVRGQNPAVEFREKALPHQLPPAIYVNGVRAEGFYIDPDQIESINVTKGHDSVTNTEGRIDIKMKFAPYWESLGDISRGLGVNGNGKVLYIVDDKLIEDTSLIKIDYSYMVSREVVNAGKAAYFGGDRGVTLVMIRTKAKMPQFRMAAFPWEPKGADSARPATIIIRGTE